MDGLWPYLALERKTCCLRSDLHSFPVFTGIYFFSVPQSPACGDPYPSLLPSCCKPMVPHRTLLLIRIAACNFLLTRLEPCKGPGTPAAGLTDMPDVMLHQVMMPSNMGPPPFKSRSKRSMPIPNASPSGTNKNCELNAGCRDSNLSLHVQAMLFVCGSQAGRTQRCWLSCEHNPLPRAWEHVRGPPSRLGGSRRPAPEMTSTVRAAPPAGPGTRSGAIHGLCDGCAMQWQALHGARMCAHMTVHAQPQIACLSLLGASLPDPGGRAMAM